MQFRFSSLGFNRIILLFIYCDETRSTKGAYSFYSLLKNYGQLITKPTLHFPPVVSFSLLCLSGSKTLTFFIAVILSISNVAFSQNCGSYEPTTMSSTWYRCSQIVPRVVKLH